MQAKIEGHLKLSVGSTGWGQYVDSQTTVAMTSSWMHYVSSRFTSNNQNPTDPMAKAEAFQTL